VYSGFDKTISILDFIRTGKFDIVELGFSYYSIIRELTKPDDVTRMTRGIYIWRYGAFEFHFFDGILITLWCDNLDYMYSPRKKQFKLDRWIIGKYKTGFSLPRFIEALHYENITFKIKGTFYSSISKESLPDNVILEIDNSTSFIYFEDIDDDAISYYDYKLIAIGSSRRSPSSTTYLL